MTVERGVHDDRAFGAELAALRPALERQARGLCGCAAEAQDLASAATLKAWTHRSSFEPGTRMGAWASFILRNEFLSRRRRARFSGGSVEDLPPAAMPSGRGAQEDAMHLADALRAIRLLPKDQRVAIALVGAGATYEEAAEETCVALGTIKSRVARGRDGLQELLA